MARHVLRPLWLPSVVLFPLTALLFVLALPARIESHDEHVFLRAWDVLVGLLFAASFLFARHPRPVSLGVAFIAATLGLLPSGFLLSMHEVQVYSRRTVREQATRFQIKNLHDALTAYQKDCGSFPTEAQGLDALVASPGQTGLNGPFALEEPDLVDPWVQPLRYAVRDNRPVVWSCAKDRVSGTEDDFAVEYRGRRRLPGRQRWRRAFAARPACPVVHVGE